MTFAPGSFRDPDARLLAGDEPAVRRALSAAAADGDARLRSLGLFDELERAGWLVPSRRRDDVAPPPGWAAVVESDRLPFVSYPYEWSFGMLRDAALLTLRIAEHALERGAVLKDASAYNVLFAGTAPVFVDVASLIERRRDAPWVAYGQFCDHFLAPLLLEAYRGVPFQPFLRGALDGLAIGAGLAPLLSGRDLLRRGALAHVALRALLDRRARRLGGAARRRVRELPLPVAAVRRNLRGLRRLVAGLRSRAVGDWADYASGGPADDATVARKTAFVAAACERLGGGRLAWDLGANTGRYSRVLARHYACVVALDADAGAVDRLYDELRRGEQARTVLPMVADLMDPSPPRGWRNRERAGLWQRGRPELALYLALIHHLCLGRGVPLDELVALIAETSDAAAVEFVSADDPMSEALLAPAPARAAGYDLATFRTLVGQRFDVIAEEALTRTRQLLLLTRR